MRSTFRMIEPASVAAHLENACAELKSAPVILDVAHLPRVSALLMCGEFERVRPLLTRPAPSPALPLAAAWYHAWSGDLPTVMACFDTVKSSVDLVDAAGDAGLQGETWVWLERTATDAGDPALAAALVRRARSAHDAAAIAYDGPAAIVRDVVTGLLGVEPDAHRGRIRLRPRIGSHDAIAAADIRFADGAVSLDARRGGDSVTFTVEQVAGAMPFTVVLEPILDVAAAAEVDGRPARLDVRPHGQEVIVPVQLVLDEIRTLTVRTQ